jgi:hypothetical protein
MNNESKEKPHRPFADATGSARDWPEDFQYENGNYQCQCIYCAEYFIGHKRRFVCKVCDGLPGETVTTTERSSGSEPSAAAKG